MDICYWHSNISNITILIAYSVVDFYQHIQVAISEICHPEACQVILYAQAHLWSGKASEELTGNKPDLACGCLASQLSEPGSDVWLKGDTNLDQVDIHV